MEGSPNIARIGALLGDTARANMLTALMSGKALTVSELAREAGVTIQTASAHLSKLEHGGLLRLRKQGRHKFFALASDEVARVLESLMGLVEGANRLRVLTGPKDVALRKARVCYNHLAGDMGIQLYESLLAQGYIVRRGGQPVLSDTGQDMVVGFGIDLAHLQTGKSPLCRECLDWSERRSHLAGSLGRAFLGRLEELRWLKRDEGTRILKFTKQGELAFNKTFPL
ncbi:MAG: helix-turn-helix transcriptional regulator [Gammaproteobacteria bacterium]|nr:helix-turn-helix transcriptional regulator [Gammaproteobacteria bacterium]